MPMAPCRARFPVGAPEFPANTDWAMEAVPTLLFRAAMCPCPSLRWLVMFGAFPASQCKHFTSSRSTCVFEITPEDEHPHSVRSKDLRLRLPTGSPSKSPMYSQRHLEVGLLLSGSVCLPLSRPGCCRRCVEVFGLPWWSPLCYIA